MSMVSRRRPPHMQTLSGTLPQEATKLLPSQASPSSFSSNGIQLDTHLDLSFLYVSANSMTKVNVFPRVFCPWGPGGARRYCNR